MKTIYVATTNKGKIKEFEQILSGLSVEIESLQDHVTNMEDVEETGVTFEENAVLKAKTYAKRHNLAVIADDSGLEVDALNGEPGVYSARYAGEEKSDDANIEKVLTKLDEKNADDRSAAFVCVMAYAEPGEEVLTTKGKCHGKITNERRGIKGFGYDPIFQPDGYDQTLSELGSTVKNEISHRRMALNDMVKVLSEKVSG
ncbi:XTP/dITP diphosphatase [Alkalibacillus haloalkaliphilus]|uniref:dITP/XTP pyrophosphatase n=1 Tax=Alkalibacillus haloalkaliphilus TaxID=94136 RepID=A0A511W413_9BACI|nr:XTP/dITP diphosphatase [Alkalibacillus haloalkaliphilus]GEN45836.1 non-canonical purine NTP pyrophosphatase [Alkalibacillus haloalkaliphilus]